MIIKDKEFGSLEVFTLPLADDVDVESGTYTYSGRVLVSECKPDDPRGRDFYRLFTVNDDGTDICEIYNGQIPQLKGANGVRWMCFADNKRVLLGDYVIECEPDLDTCTSSELIPLEYPAETAGAPGVFFRWSEIIISADNEHMCWTQLGSAAAGCYLGRLVRGESGYHIEDVCMVSSVSAYADDPDHPGCKVPLPTRGGEVKQFVHGGRALSVVGDSPSLTESVVQYLDSEDMQRITYTPGYEETTMFSPDEKLGLVMSPRFSKKTNCGILGLVPQPGAEAGRGMMNAAYMYAVAGVRKSRKGNIGPVLIDIEKSLAEKRAYKGVCLADPEEKWVYYSPMSWHPASTRVMWKEGLRTAEGPVKHRIRICCLLDKEPSEPVPFIGTPDKDKIPYAVPAGTPVTGTSYPVKIAGRHSGFLINNAEQKDGFMIATSTYTDYSDDGRTYYNGTVSSKAPMNIFLGGRNTFRSDLTVTGEHYGEMKFGLTLNLVSAAGPADPVFGPGEDGRPLSYGYAAYDGVVIRVEDMEP